MNTPKPGPQTTQNSTKINNENGKDIKGTLPKRIRKPRKITLKSTLKTVNIAKEQFQNGSANHVKFN